MPPALIVTLLFVGRSVGLDTHEQSWSPILLENDSYNPTEAAKVVCVHHIGWRPSTLH